MMSNGRDLRQYSEHASLKARRERLTLVRIFEELQGLGYRGGYDAVRRYLPFAQSGSPAAVPPDQQALRADLGDRHHQPSVRRMAGGDTAARRWSTH